MSNSCNLMEKWPKVLHIYTYYSNQITIIIMSINFCIICSSEIFKRYWFKKENFTINITESGKSHYCYGNSHPFHSSLFPGMQRNLFLCTVDWPSTFQALLIFHYILIFSIDMLQLNMLPSCILLPRKEMELEANRIMHRS